MWLFSKRAKKVVKYLWGGISILIALSMIITYSGFTLLARTPAPEPAPTTDLATTQTPTSTAQDLINAALATTTLPGGAEIVPHEDTSSNTPPAPPVQKLDFSL
jgi:hypothetical protein